MTAIRLSWAALALLFGACSKLSGKSPGTESRPPTDEIPKMESEDDYQRFFVKAKKPVLVVFGGEWCKPCKELEPRLSELWRRWRGSIEMARVDFPRPEELARQIGSGSLAARFFEACQANNLPAAILFRGGQVLKDCKGAEVLGRYDSNPETSETAFEGIKSLLEKTITASP